MARIWDKVKYVRIEKIANKVQARKARRERMLFLRFLKTTVYADLAERVQAIHDAPHLNGQTKNQHFAEVLKDYAALIMSTQTETAPGVPMDPMVLHDGGMAPDTGGDGAVSDGTSGNRPVPDRGAQQVVIDEGSGAE